MSSRRHRHSSARLHSIYVENPSTLEVTTATTTKMPVTCSSVWEGGRGGRGGVASGGTVASSPIINWKTAVCDRGSIYVIASRSRKLARGHPARGVVRQKVFSCCEHINDVYIRSEPPASLIESLPQVLRSTSMRLHGRILQELVRWICVYICMRNCILFFVTTLLRIWLSELLIESTLNAVNINHTHTQTHCYVFGRFM